MSLASEEMLAVMCRLAAVGTDVETSILDVPFLTGQLAIDISTKVINNLIHSRPGAGQTHTKVKIGDSELPLVRSPELLGVYLDTIFSFNTHCVQVANRVSKRNNVLKALAGTNWGPQKKNENLTAHQRIF